jgi:putative DNA methylase
VRTLLETTIPVDVLNAACEQDKNVKTGHIRSIHKWFAPMPLPAWRALIYSALIPYDKSTVDKHFKIVERLASRRGSDLKKALIEAKSEILNIWGPNPPTIVDPFCGGGSTIVEAQRLGLNTLAADLNPIPVLITTALTGLYSGLKERLNLAWMKLCRMPLALYFRISNILGNRSLPQHETGLGCFIRPSS